MRLTMVAVYQRGRDARRASPTYQNPYSPGTPERDAYDEGWRWQDTFIKQHERVKAWQ